MVAVVLDDVVVHVDQDPAGGGEWLGQGQHIERFAGQLSRGTGHHCSGFPVVTGSELGVTSLTKPRSMGKALSEMSPHKIHVKNGFYCPVIDQGTRMPTSPSPGQAQGTAQRPPSPSGAEAQPR